MSALSLSLSLSLSLLGERSVSLSLLGERSVSLSLLGERSLSLLAELSLSLPQYLLFVVALWSLCLMERERLMAFLTRRKIEAELVERMLVK